MSDLSDVRAVGEPGWLFARSRSEPCTGDEAAAFLGELEDEDLEIMALAYGLGLRVGSLCQATGLDPAIVVWRLHRAFSRWREGSASGTPRDCGALERGLSDLLSGGSSTSRPPLEGRDGWGAAALLVGLPDDVQSRLADNPSLQAPAQPPAPGVGIGLAVIVLAVALGFLGFGIVRDVDPMRRGEALMRQYEYTLARDAFVKVGTVESRTRIVLCQLAEGRFEEAIADLEDDDVRQWFRQFAPSGDPVPIQDAPEDSRALLPRGLLTVMRPEFVVRSGPPGDLVLTVQQRERRIELPDTRGGSESFVVPYPEDWPSLPAGRIVWHVEDGDDNAAAFDVADLATIQRIRDRNWRVLTRDVPQRAQLFLRGHHFLAEGLLVQAGGQFARLAEVFPAEPYPRQQVWAVAEALGVDPTALLR